MKWKIGDWCEVNSVRYFVYRLDNEAVNAVSIDGERCRFLGSAPSVVKLPDCTGWDWQPSPVIGDDYVEVDVADAEDGDEVFDDGIWQKFYTEIVYGNGRDKVWCRRKKLQLREGAWYERADGEIVGPCQRTDHRTSKWFLKGLVYCDDGTNSGRADVHIVREVPEPKPTYRPFANGSEYEPQMIAEFNRLQQRIGRILTLEFIDNDTLQFSYHAGCFVVHGNTGKVLQVIDPMAEDEETEAARYIWYLLNDYVRDRKGNYWPRENAPVESM